MAITSRAAAVRLSVPLCLLALNSFDRGAFDMNGNSKLNAPTCGVQANTKSSSGMTTEGKPSAVAGAFKVYGGYTGDSYSTSPLPNGGKISDPYDSMPFPAHGACAKNSKATVVNGGSVTLSPGTYCGGITIKAQTHLTLKPGIYVMVNGSFYVNGQSTVTGREVMIAFKGVDATLRLWGGSTLDLTSPSSGTYTNFQFFQDESDMNGRGQSVSLGGSNGDTSKATWDGIAYFPTQNFWVYGNAKVNVNSPYTAVVAGKVWIQGNATLNVSTNNTRNLAVKEVMMEVPVRLVE